MSHISVVRWSAPAGCGRMGVDTGSGLSFLIVSVGCGRVGVGSPVPTG